MQANMDVQYQLNKGSIYICLTLRELETNKILCLDFYSIRLVELNGYIVTIFLNEEELVCVWRIGDGTREGKRE